jgi:ABC-type lipoprotein release transport system permease subunit
VRNLGRRKGRTALTIGMLLMATWMQSMLVCINEGTYEDMIRMATGTWTGQAQIQHPGYRQSPALYETLADPAPILEKLRQTPGVMGAAPRIETGALLSLGVRTSGAMIVGLDPAAEKTASTVARTVKTGSFLGAPRKAGALPMTLGTGLARRLHAKLGDEITLLGQAADGSMAAELFEVVGLTETRTTELDGNLALIRLADAAQLLELGQRVHTVVVSLQHPQLADGFQADFVPPPGAVVLHWRELLPGMQDAMDADHTGNIVFLVVILLVATLGGVNAMLMTVMERRRETGVLLALGTTPGRVVGELVWESTLQAILGVSGGLAATILSVLAFGDAGIRFTDQPMEFAGAVFDAVHPLINWRTYAYAAVILGVSSLAGLWPALRIARMTPLEAMRAEARG